MANIPMIRYIADKLIEVETQEEKQAILERYNSDTLFKRVLYYTYNPMIVFGMNDYNPECTGREDGMGISKFMHIPEDLYNNRLTPEEAIFACKLVLSHINQYESEIFIGMLHKDIGVGLTIETINNVWPDYIPQFPIQYPIKYTEENKENIIFPAVVQPIMTGDRISIVVRSKVVEYYDEQGKQRLDLEEYSPQFVELAQENNIMYDGTYIKNSKKPFVLWDSIRYDGFVRGNENRIGYNWRFNGIEHMIMLALDADKDVCYRSVISKSVNNWEDVKSAQKELPVEYIIKSLQSEWKGGTNSQTMFVPLNF
jgi:hypothetical protein